MVISERPNIVPCYPFKDLGFGFKDVTDTLQRAGLGFPAYYKWRSRSGCYFCFYQQRGEWAGLKEQHPGLFEKARAFERADGGQRYTWIQGKTLDEVAASASPNREEISEPLGAEGCAICHL